MMRTARAARSTLLFAVAAALLVALPLRGESVEVDVRLTIPPEESSRRSFR